MKQQQVGAFAWIVACALVASVSAARGQSLEVESEASFSEDFGPLRTGFGQAVALSADGTRALVGIPGFSLSSASAGVPWSMAGSAIVFVRTGGTWTEEARLEPEQGELSAAFGHAVALSAAGDVALIGAPSDAGGTVRVFTREGASWSPAATLSAAAGQLDDRFGAAVAVSANGSLALVGASMADTTHGADAGRVHVFAEAGGAWTEQAVLEAVGAHAGEDFGRSVALSADGSSALIGAPQTETELGEGVGSARAFERAGAVWNETALLRALDGAARERFGAAVALAADGATALIGVPDDDDEQPSTTSSGSARVFVLEGQAWSEEATLRGGAEDFGWLGASVALSADGQRAIVGSPLSNLPIQAIGDAHVYERDGAVWSVLHRLRVGGGESGDRVGASVALSADGAYALIGAPGDDVAGAPDQGVVHVIADPAGTPAWQAVLAVAPEWHEQAFGTTIAITPDGTRAVVAAPETRIADAADAGMVRVLARDGQTWRVEARLRAQDGAAGDRFGHSVAISADGATIVIGAPFDDSASGVDSGSVRVFSRTGTEWTEGVLGYGAQRGVGFGYAVAISADAQRVLVGAPSPESEYPQRGRASVFVRSGGGFVSEGLLALPVPEQVFMIGTSLAIDAHGERAVVSMYDVAEQRLKPRVFVRVGSSWLKEATLASITAPFVSVVPLFMSAAGDRILADDLVYSRAGNVWTSQSIEGPGLALSPDGERAVVAMGPRIGEVRSAGICALGQRAWACRTLVAGLAHVASAALAEGATRVMLGNMNAGWRQNSVHLMRADVAPEVCEADCDDGGVEPDASAPDAGEGDAGMMSDAGQLPDAGEAGAGGTSAGAGGTSAGAGGTSAGAGGASGDGDPMAGAGSDPMSDAGCEIIVNESSDCSCRIAGTRASGQRPLWLAIALTLVLVARRRRRTFQLRSR